MKQSLKLKGQNIFLEKLFNLQWFLIFLIVVMAMIGFTALYSAAGGNYDPWASKQIMRFVFGMAGLLIIAFINTSWWYQLSYPIYFVGFLMLIIVEIMGHTGMGAQRWINLGFIQLQPSEFMKIAVVMALAKYFHLASPEDIKSLRFLFIGSLFIIAPVALVMFQPDLGTALMILMAGAALLFLAGAPLWIFITSGGLAILSLPVGWYFLHDYQKARVMTFLNPESDPLGAGYHITQSKIALGSGGVQGKGFLEGTQSRLNFLPEKQTDFIFTLWAEEWGLVGGAFLLLIVSLILFYSIRISLRCKYVYTRLLTMGLAVNFFLYVFINIAMVMGIIPVVGAPLPLVSYGGTSMLAVLTAFGLILSCQVHRDKKLMRT